MHAPSFESFCRRRASRARLLAERFPEAGEGLAFYARIASLQGRISAVAPLESLPRLVELVLSHGPELLKETARTLELEGCRHALEQYRSGEDRTSPRSFFARVLLQAAMARQRPEPRPGAHGRGCPHCGHLPQVGSLRPQGDGTALALACSLCFGEWTYSRSSCPACGESDASRRAFYEASELPHVQVQTCDRCRRYLHLIHFAKEPEAVADADELAALPLDVWARERGYVKVFPNLIGI